MTNLYNRHLMTGPKGNNELCFPDTLSGFASGNNEVERKQNSLFPAGALIKWFVIASNSKIGEKTSKKSFAWRRLPNNFAAVSRSMTWSRASRKFKLLFPRELGPVHMEVGDPGEVKYLIYPW